MVLVNLSSDFASFYLWRLNDYIHYGDPRPGLICDEKFPGGIGWDNPLYGSGLSLSDQ